MRKLRPLTNTNGAGLRLCASCGSSNKTKGWACAVCGNNAIPRYGLDRTGREACRSCFEAECTEDPASDLLQFLAGRPLRVSEDTLRAVIAEVTEGKLTVTRRLHWDVQNDPALLTGQTNHYSPRTVLLVDRLHHAGATGVSAPKCPPARPVLLGHSIKTAPSLWQLLQPLPRRTLQVVQSLPHPRRQRRQWGPVLQHLPR